ncbi:MAG: polyprenyl synthetase family protein [Sulfolobales archaeon]
MRVRYMGLAVGIDLKDLIEYIESRKAVIEAELEKAIKGYEGEVLEIINYMSKGGKRFRGILTILVCETLGGRVDDALDAAVAIELVHAASLALDDIIDFDTIRRGSLASWIRYGISKTVLISNMLIPKAQLMIERYGFDALVKVIEAWLQATSGEVMDVFGPSSAVAGYETLARLKTGSVFKASTFLGARAARAGKNLEDLSTSFGENLGILYQIADDLVDVLLEKIDERTHGIKMFMEWLGSKKREEVIERALSKISIYIKRLETMISRYPKNRYRDYLSIIPRYMVYSMLKEAGREGEEVYRSIVEATG